MPLSDHDLLIVIAGNVKDIKESLGNPSQPGLIRDVAVLKDEMEEHKREARTLQESSGGWRNAAKNGGLASLLFVALTVVKQVFWPTG